MCLEWGLDPEIYDKKRWHRKMEMWKFWVWKNERENMLREKAQMESKQRGGVR